MKPASALRAVDAPLTEAELELIDAIADWQAKRHFARLQAAAPRPGTLDDGAARESKD